MRAELVVLGALAGLVVAALPVPARPESESVWLRKLERQLEHDVLLERRAAGGEGDATGPVLVAARALRTRTTIRPEDVIGVDVPVGRVPPDAIREPALLVGRRTTRSVAEGTPWREVLVADAPAVERGHPVRLLIARGGLRIEATGRARQDGRVGDTVRVLNETSRREVLGVVAEKGVVLVSF